MKSQVLVLSRQSATAAMLAAVIACSLFAYQAPKAQATGLTSEQKQAILTLVSAFGADQATIERVTASLNGQATAGTGTTTTSSAQCPQGFHMVDSHCAPICAAGQILQNNQCVPANTTVTCAAGYVFEDGACYAAPVSSTTPLTIAITYPTKGEIYDITTATHVGTRIYLGWLANKRLPLGSLVCTWLTKGGVTYPHPDTGNCIQSTQTAGSIQGYTTVPAGTYVPKVTVYDASGAKVAEGTGSSFGIAVLDHKSQEVKAALDSGSVYYTGTPTFTGTASVTPLVIQLFLNGTPWSAAGVDVVNGRWSYTIGNALSQGVYNLVILNQGDVLATYPVALYPTRTDPTPILATPGVASLTATPTAAAINTVVNFTGSSGNGCDGKSYILNFGDGFSYTKTVSNRSCDPLLKQGHIYKTPGTYTVKLLSATTCTSTSACAAVASTISSVSVTITTYAPTTPATPTTSTPMPILCPTGQTSQNGSCVPVITTLNSITTVRQFYTHLYSCVLGKTPDTDGFNWWYNGHVNGSASAITSAYSGFFGSAEYVAKNTSNATFVESLYTCVLFRASDPGGKAYWLADLTSGRTRAQVLTDFMANTEFQQNVLLKLKDLAYSVSSNSSGFGAFDFVVAYSNAFNQNLAVVADGAVRVPLYLFTDALSNIFLTMGVGVNAQTATVYAADYSVASDQLSEKSSTEKALQFVSDYSDSFNENMAAVATATIALPVNALTSILSNLFYTVGVGR